MTNHRSLWCVAAVGASLLVSSAYAQQAALEEIVVTATKRQKTLQEVPVAVSVTDAATIEKAQVLDILDLQAMVPSLRVTQLQSSKNTNFLIRGFGNGANNPGIEPSVGVFIDGVYRSRSAAAIADLPNLERVEVLRGPQSTLFGKNASAGVISVITALPDEEFGGSAEFVVGNLGQTVLKGAISGPISDQAGFSLSAGTNHRDGYSDNLVDGSEFNERDRWYTNAQLYLTPEDNISIRFLADYGKIDELCCGVGNLLNGPTFLAITDPAVGGALFPEQPFARQAYYNYNPTNVIENSGISMQVDYDFENSTLTSITAQRSADAFEDFDADFTSAEILSENVTDTAIDTFTQELRLSSTSGESADWMIGAFFFEEDVDYDTNLVFGADARTYLDLLVSLINGMVPPVQGTLPFVEASLAGIPLFTGDPANPVVFPYSTVPGSIFADGTSVFEEARQRNTALSIYGQLDWYITDRTTITLGLNNTQDDKDVSLSQVNNNVFSQIDLEYAGFLGAFAQLVQAGFDPADPATQAIAQGIAADPAQNSLLALKPLQVVPPIAGYPNAVEDGTSRDSDTTWTARVAFDLNDDVNLYASASTGFKSTSWNLSRDSRPLASDLAAVQADAASSPAYPFPIPPGTGIPNLASGTRFAGPEESTVYELGLKARFDRGSINLALFDQTLEGFQLNIFQGTGFQLVNAGKQSAVGLEVDATWVPIDPLLITFAGTFMDPKYDSFPGAPGIGGPTDLTGEQPASIHEQSIVTSATYTHDFANGMSGFIRGEYLYESDVQAVDNVPASIASREVNVFNASMGLSTESGWEYLLWGRNLTDDEYLLSAFPTVFQEGSVSGYANQPATYGLTVRKYF